MIANRDAANAVMASPYLLEIWSIIDVYSKGLELKLTVSDVSELHRTQSF